jgi:hypothetical protein
MDQVAAGFSLTRNPLSSRVQDLLVLTHDDLVTRHISAHANAEFPTREAYPRCGLIVDATAQDGGRPAGPFEDARKYFSGEHFCYCLKSQVITNREGLAVHVVVGMPGAKHDFVLFRENLRSIEEPIAYDAQ